ncbi:MAG: hypothetical protein QM733_03850 [Ilumatobacteraceae bacterium]
MPSATWTTAIDGVAPAGRCAAAARARQVADELRSRVGHAEDVAEVGDVVVDDIDVGRGGLVDAVAGEHVGTGAKLGDVVVAEAAVGAGELVLVVGQEEVGAGADHHLP